MIIFQWFHNEVDKLFIASKAVMRKAMKEGVDTSRLFQLGLPVREQFWVDRGGEISTVTKGKRGTSERRKKLRVELGLDPNNKAVMIIGGGEGAGIEYLATSVIWCLGEELAVPSQVGQSRLIIVD